MNSMIFHISFKGNRPVKRYQKKRLRKMMISSGNHWTFSKTFLLLVPFHLGRQAGLRHFYCNLMDFPLDRKSKITNEIAFSWALIKDEIIENQEIFPVFYVISNPLCGYVPEFMKNSAIIWKKSSFWWNISPNDSFLSISGLRIHVYFPFIICSTRLWKKMNAEFLRT